MESQKSKNNQYTKSNRQIELISDQIAHLSLPASIGWVALSFLVCLFVYGDISSFLFSILCLFWQLGQPRQPCNPFTLVTPINEQGSEVPWVFFWVLKKALKRRSTKKALKDFICQLKKAVSLFKAIIWGLKKVDLLCWALFWVVFFLVLFWALKKTPKVLRNLFAKRITMLQGRSPQNGTVISGGCKNKVTSFWWLFGAFWDD